MSSAVRVGQGRKRFRNIFRKKIGCRKYLKKNFRGNNVQKIFREDNERKIFGEDNFRKIFGEDNV